MCRALKPQADVVLQCKLDPVDDLGKLRHHGQHSDSNEVLQDNRRVSSTTHNEDCFKLKNLRHKQSLQTWEMEEWVRMGSMFSVQRSAQHVISTVATISTARALQRDQCTTWWPAGDKSTFQAEPFKQSGDVLCEVVGAGDLSVHTDHAHGPRDHR